MSRLLLLSLLPLALHAGTTPALKTAAAKNPKAPVQALELPPEALGWTLGAGLQWRQIGEVSFGGGHHARASDIPVMRGESSGSGSGYSNGYVRPDSTNGPNTWNWGFNDPSQVVGNTLTFSGSNTEIFQRVLAQSLDSAWSEDLAGLGIYFELESPTLLKWKRFNLSAVAGYSFVQDETERSLDAFSAVRQTMLIHNSFTDAYDISGIAPVAPQQGTFNGPGPVISRTPISRTGGHGSTATMLDDEVITSRVEQSFKINLHTLSLGPRIGMDFGKLRATAGLGLAINLADWEASSNETLRSESGKVLKRWQDSTSELEILFGGYAELGAHYAINERWSINANLRYDLSQDLSGQVANTPIHLDLGGFTAMVGVGWRF